MLDWREKKSIVSFENGKSIKAEINFEVKLLQPDVNFDVRISAVGWEKKKKKALHNSHSETRLEIKCICVMETLSVPGVFRVSVPRQIVLTFQIMCSLSFQPLPPRTKRLPVSKLRSTKAPPVVEVLTC